MSATLKLKDVKLWDGFSPIFLKGYTFNPSSVGSVLLSAEARIDDDRRLITGIDAKGIHYFLYHSSDGFRHIVKDCSK